MTLPNFIEFEPFNSFRRLMNAPLPDNFSSGYIINGLCDDLDKALEGIEGITLDDISDVEILPDGTLAYKGRRVLLYIRDKPRYRDHEPRERLPSFHLSNCKTLERMRAEGRYERYVVTQRTDGKFKMNSLFSNGNTQSEIRELKVCHNCLAYLSYKSYSYKNPRRHQIHFSFSLGEYFAAYPKNLVSGLPLHTDRTAPLNHYSNGFREASTRYRAEHNWTCENEKCEVDLSDPSYRKYLHTHHVNAQKYDDRKENHRALCIRCHAEEPMHAYLKNSPEYRAFIKIYADLLHQITR